jgi:hypothetical protein
MLCFGIQMLPNSGFARNLPRLSKRVDSCAYPRKPARIILASDLQRLQRPGSPDRAMVKYNRDEKIKDRWETCERM